MTNRLVNSQSLYLRKHAENPIDWWPWCAEALEAAKREDKPIFLSIGYSSCHWCTVMEGEAFSDGTIAEYMNGHFIPIKVDREERPDIDSIYMQTLQMMTGQGGWPLNVVLAPDDLVPFYGGTYFPLEPKYGRPGFLQVLQALRRYYDTEKEKVRSLKSELLGYLQQSAILSAGPSDQLTQKLLENGIETNTSVLVPTGNGTSFPMIPHGENALRGIRFQINSHYEIKQVCEQRGLDLALGGIYDHVAGGFHRYTVDPTWTVPHFEKMLYDNGQIVEYLANLWSSGYSEPAFERAISGTVAWLKREMTAPEGYFYAAQDADSFISSNEKEPEEGAFYVWSFGELQDFLSSAELSELQQNFTISIGGNFEGNNVLQCRHPGELSDSLKQTLEKLFTLRYGSFPAEISTFPPARNNEEAKGLNWPGKIPPVTDPKMIVAWNSLMISGLARAYQVFGVADYLELAENAANFILNHQFVAGRLHRLNYELTPAVIAQSEDYALFIKALLDLHQANVTTAKAPFWLEKAVQLQGEFDQYLWSEEFGGYYNTDRESGQELLVRERSYQDNATPSANGIAAANLVKLALLTEDLGYLDQTEKTLQAFTQVMERSPQACPSLFSALDWYLHPTLVKSHGETLETLTRQYFPAAVFIQEANLPDQSIGLVCQGLTCKEPAQSLEQMVQQIQGSGMAT